VAEKVAGLAVVVDPLLVVVCPVVVLAGGGVEALVAGAEERLGLVAAVTASPSTALR